LEIGNRINSKGPPKKGEKWGGTWHKGHPGANYYVGRITKKKKNSPANM